MKWYYVEAGQQMGPVDDATLISMAAGGQIAPETLVWKEGMANWQPYSEVAPAAAGSPLRISRPAGPAPSAAPGSEEAVCAECGQLFPVTETIRIGDSRVCANCKPTFVQKMREGLTVGTVSMRYAGFWIRVAAKILDGFILGCVVVTPLVVIFIFVIAGVAARRGSGSFIDTGGSILHASALGGPAAGSNFAGTAIQVFVQVISLFVNMFYTTFFVGKYGATPGKMICKIRVVDAGGGKIGYGRAFGRYWAELLSGIVCYIGYIMVAFDDEKRGLHDRICSTRVVYK